MSTMFIKNDLCFTGVSQVMKQHLRSLATIENPQWQVAQEQYLRGIKRYIHLWEDNGNELHLPRGYIHQVILGFQKSGIHLNVIDQRVERNFKINNYKIINLYPHQVHAAIDLTKAEQGIYHAPPATGKTVTALEVIRSLGQKTLIIVEKLDIAYQWIDRAKEHLGINMGLIGDGKHQPKIVTVALQQTLWSQKDQLDAKKFWNSWGMVIVDECHHMQATTFQEIINRFPAKYRFGLSATPSKNLNTWPLIRAYLGGIVASSEAQTLNPHIQVRKTAFHFDYYPTVQYGSRIERNNYGELLDALTIDPDRNFLIANDIAKNKDQSCLVLSRRLKQIDELYNLLTNLNIPNVYKLIGKISSAERNKIIELANTLDNIILLSSVADEALDIPKLNRLFLVFPTSNIQTVKQQIGRIQREHPEKKDAIVYDYWDETGPLNQQFRKRYSFYFDQKFEIDINPPTRARVCA